MNEVKDLCQEKSTGPTGSSQVSLLDDYISSMTQSLENRKMHKVIEGTGNEEQDLTPALLKDDWIRRRLFGLTMRIRERESPSTHPSDNSTVDHKSDVESRPSGSSFMDNYTSSMAQSQENRLSQQVTEETGSGEQNIKPVLLEDDWIKRRLFGLTLRIREREPSIEKFRAAGNTFPVDHISNMWPRPLMLHSSRGEQDLDSEDDEKFMGLDPPKLRKTQRII